MVRPDYRDFRRSKFIFGTSQHLEHSAKGTTWKDHIYIKRIDGTYYYPDSYEGGRHLPDGEKDTESSKSKDSSESGDTISKLEDMTGMTRESLLELRDLSRKNGYDSDEFKEMLSILSEGDDDQAKKMVDLLKQDDKISLTSEDVEKLAREVIRGNFGNGQVRKDLLGENYSEIQKRVNELMKSSTGSKNVSEATEESIKKAEEAAKNASTPTKETKVHSGVDMDRVLNVYNKKKKGG